MPALPAVLSSSSRLLPCRLACANAGKCCAQARAVQPGASRAALPPAPHPPATLPPLDPAQREPLFVGSKWEVECEWPRGEVASPRPAVALLSSAWPARVGCSCARPALFSQPSPRLRRRLQTWRACWPASPSRKQAPSFEARSRRAYWMTLCAAMAGAHRATPPYSLSLPLPLPVVYNCSPLPAPMLIYPLSPSL